MAGEGRSPAPYKGMNGDGKYDPGEQTFRASRAPDQTLYYVANDLDSARTKNLYYFLADRTGDAPNRLGLHSR